MKFSGVIKTLCLCGCVFGGMCEDVAGMSSNESNIEDNISTLSGKVLEITSHDDFSTLTPQQVQSFEKVVFKGLKGLCSSDWYELLYYHGFDSIVFDNCSFPAFSYSFDGICTRNLVVTGCDLRPYDIPSVLYVDTYSLIGTLDLSNNHLGDDEDELAENLNRYIAGVFGLDLLDLRENNLSRSFIHKLHLNGSVGRVLI